MKPFWKSRKFGYTVGTLLASLLIALLAGVEGVTPETKAALADVLPGVMTLGALLVLGHTVTDSVAVYKEGVPALDLKDALQDVVVQILDELFADDEPEPVPDV